MADQFHSENCFMWHLHCNTPCKCDPPRPFRDDLLTPSTAPQGQSHNQAEPRSVGATQPPVTQPATTKPAVLQRQPLPSNSAAPPGQPETKGPPLGSSRPSGGETGKAAPSGQSKPYGKTLAINPFLSREALLWKERTSRMQALKDASNDRSAYCLLCHRPGHLHNACGFMTEFGEASLTVYKHYDAGIDGQMFYSEYMAKAPQDFATLVQHLHEIGMVLEMFDPYVKSRDALQLKMFTRARGEPIEKHETLVAFLQAAVDQNLAALEFMKRLQALCKTFNTKMFYHLTSYGLNDRSTKKPDVVTEILRHPGLVAKAWPTFAAALGAFKMSVDEAVEAFLKANDPWRTALADHLDSLQCSRITDQDYLAAQYILILEQMSININDSAWLLVTFIEDPTMTRASRACDHACLDVLDALREADPESNIRDDGGVSSPDTTNKDYGMDDSVDPSEVSGSVIEALDDEDPDLAVGDDAAGGQKTDLEEGEVDRLENAEKVDWEVKYQ